VFWVLRFQHNTGGSQIEAWSEPARQPIGPAPDFTTEGRYRIVREGTTMIGQYAPLGGDVFVTLGVLDNAYAGPMHVELLGRQGASFEGTRTAMDIAFENLIVEADRVRGLTPRFGSAGRR